MQDGASPRSTVHNSPAPAGKRPTLSLKRPPAACPPAKPNWAARYRRTRPLLAARYPLIFSAARPLAIGIDKHLRAALSEDELSTDDLRAFVAIWCRRKPYRAALARGVRRIKLDGSDAGPADVCAMVAQTPGDEGGRPGTEVKGGGK